MKKTSLSFFSAISTLLLTHSSPSIALSFDPFEEFKQQVAANLLEPFAKDLGSILGGGTFHTGRNLGFPGVDIGGHLAIQKKPSENNKILNSAGVGIFGLPMVQGEVGLPFKIDVMLRGISVQDLTVVGGGLRYGIFKFGVPMLASVGVSVSAFMHSLNHSAFSVSHQAANVTVDAAIPLLTPYVGFGMDRTTVKVGSANNAALQGLEATAQGTRITAGVNLKLIPLTYLHGAVTMYNGNPGYEAGMGLKF